MKLRYFGIGIFGVSFLAVASCAENDDAAVVGDAGDSSTVIVTPDASDDALADGGDAAVPADDCSAEWCSVPLSDLTNVSLSAVWGSAPNDVWVVGSKGFAAHFDGSKWDTHRPDTLATLFSVWGTGPSDVWAANAGTSIFHWQGSSWEKSSIGEGDMRAVIAMSGTPSGDVLALLERGPSHTTPCEVSWGTWDTMCPGVYRLSKSGGTATWEPATSDPFLCSNLFKDQIQCAALNGLWAGPNGQPWLVGESGRALRPVSGTTPEDLTSSTDETNSVTTLESVSGSSATDVWTVGATGTVRHYTGGSDWARVSVPTSEHLRVVKATAADDVWAAGDNGALIHWNGTSWASSEVPPSAKDKSLYGVWAFAGGDVWVVGERTLLRRRSGNESKP